MATIVDGDVLVKAGIGSKKVHLVQQIAGFCCQCNMHYKGKNSQYGSTVATLNDWKASFVNDCLYNQCATESKNDLSTHGLYSTIL